MNISPLPFGLMLSVFVMSACAVSEVPSHDVGGHDGHARHASSAEHPTVTHKLKDGMLSFTIMQDGATLKKYTVSHTKEMHLIIVRNDLEHFFHLHPERDNEGVWRIAFEPPAEGTYWLYADFVDGERVPHTIRFQETIGSSSSEPEFRPHPGESVVASTGLTVEEKIVDGYRIQLAEPGRSADGIQFNFTILTQSGEEAKLQQYLGEKGHAILLSEDGDFVHLHPTEEYVGYSEDDQPVFVAHTKGVEKKFHRIFAQFQVAGRVLTASFDVDLSR